jgi:hypothetical protein
MIQSAGSTVITDLCNVETGRIAHDTKLILHKHTKACLPLELMDKSWYVHTCFIVVHNTRYGFFHSQGPVDMGHNMAEKRSG